MSPIVRGSYHAAEEVDLEESVREEHQGRDQERQAGEASRRHCLRCEAQGSGEEGQALEALAHIGKFAGALDLDECAACAFECGTVGGERVAARARGDLEACERALAHDGEANFDAACVTLKAGEEDVRFGHFCLSVCGC